MGFIEIKVPTVHVIS